MWAAANSDLPVPGLDPKYVAVAHACVFPSKVSTTNDTAASLSHPSQHIIRL